MSVIICLLIIISSVAARFEGDKCKLKDSNESGKCLLLNDCGYAKNLLKSGQKPQHCGFKNLTPMVCCPLMNKPMGQKSEKQCELYYPKPKSGMFRAFVIGGTKSLAKEFPHMAILGYGTVNHVRWLCGGSLISEKFILTAAHCVYSEEFGIVKRVRLGDLDIENTTDDASPQDFDVVDIVVHPKYRSESYYNDIALLKLDRTVVFNFYVRPACLYAKSTVPGQLIATGWGQSNFLGESSSHLMKVDLSYVNHTECAKRYSRLSRNLKKGIIDDMQICAGDEGKDTCPGDSGGPLQFKVWSPQHYYVVGITSFGKTCGIGKSVGVYTRIAQYVPWIENIVWPGG